MPNACGHCVRHGLYIVAINTVVVEEGKTITHQRKKGAI